MAAASGIVGTWNVAYWLSQEWPVSRLSAGDKMKPGDMVRFVDGDSAVVSQIKRVLFDAEDATQGLFIFESNVGSIVMRNREREAKLCPWQRTTWHVCADESTAAHALDIKVPLHARALRSLNWFQKIAREV